MNLFVKSIARHPTAIFSTAAFHMTCQDRQYIAYKQILNFIDHTEWRCFHGVINVRILYFYYCLLKRLIPDSPLFNAFKWNHIFEIREFYNKNE